MTQTAADPADGLVVSALTNCIDGSARSIVTGVFSVIDAFLAGGSELDRDLLGWEGRYLELWGGRDLAVIGSRVRVANPSGWDPMAQVEWLEPEDDSDDLRIAMAGGFGSRGQAVRRLPGGSVSYAGMTLWPESDWPAVQARLLG